MHGISSVVAFAASQFQQGAVVLDLAFLGLLGKVALSTFIAYVAGNLFQNSEGKFALDPK
jgi:hypothetical protein